jgi:hypothetical protein
VCDILFRHIADGMLPPVLVNRRGVSAVQEVLKEAGLRKLMRPGKAGSNHPDTMAPVIRNASGSERELILMRWGFPPPPNLGNAPGHQYAKSEVALLGRLAQTGVALPCAGDVIL